MGRRASTAEDVFGQLPRMRLACWGARLAGGPVHDLNVRGFPLNFLFGQPCPSSDAWRTVRAAIHPPNRLFAKGASEGRRASIEVRAAP